MVRREADPEAGAVWEPSAVRQPGHSLISTQIGLLDRQTAVSAKAFCVNIQQYPNPSAERWLSGRKQRFAKPS